MQNYLFCIFYLLLIGGCSARIPEPVDYPYSQQQKMEASHHWQVLAEDLANRINNELILTDNIHKSVSIKPTCGSEAVPCTPAETSSFNEAFRDLLITNLVGFGIPTEQQKTGETLEVLYKVQIVRHSSHRLRTLQPGLLTGLSAAIVVLRSAPANVITLALGTAIDVANANMAGNGHYEVIITTSMLEKGKYLFRASDLYYINDEDFWHYQENFTQTKTMKLTSSEKTKRDDQHQPLPITVRPVPESGDKPPSPEKNEAERKSNI